MSHHTNRYSHQPFGCNFNVKLPPPSFRTKHRTGGVGPAVPTEMSTPKFIFDFYTMQAYLAPFSHTTKRQTDDRWSKRNTMTMHARAYRRSKSEAETVKRWASCCVRCVKGTTKHMQRRNAVVKARRAAEIRSGPGRLHNDCIRDNG